MCRKLLILFFVIHIINLVSCEKLNPLGIPVRNEMDELEILKNIPLVNETIPDIKNLAKRQSYFLNENNDGNINTNSDRFVETNEQGSRRRTSFEKEVEKKEFDTQQEDYKFQNLQRPVPQYPPMMNRFQYDADARAQINRERSDGGFRIDLKRVGNYMDEGQSRFNENIMPVNYDVNAYSEANNYNNFDQKVTVEKEVQKTQSFNAENNIVNTLPVRYPIYQRSGLSSSNVQCYQCPSFCPEKGLVINFNAECPVSPHSNRRYFQKFILAPKHLSHAAVSPLGSPHETIISSPNHLSSPIYYL